MKALKVFAILLLAVMPVGADQPAVVAHRGASKQAPENTLPAFRLAWAQGADAIEGDFHLTKDGHVVCIHDGNTKKVADKNLKVRDATLEELKKLDVGAHRGKKFEGTTIPTLAEVFETVPEGKKVYVEIKCGAEIIPVLLKEVDQSKLDDKQIVVISFNKEVIQKLKARTRRFKAYWLSGMKKRSGKITPSLKKVLATLKQIRADGFSSNKNVIDEGFIQGLVAKGYEYHVWTVDDVKTARRFKAWGARSITTNVPGRIKKHLVEKKKAAVGAGKSDR